MAITTGSKQVLTYIWHLAPTGSRPARSRLRKVGERENIERPRSSHLYRLVDYMNSYIT